MKPVFPALVLFLSTVPFAVADDDRPVAVDRLPQPVAAAVADYLPGSSIVSAKEDDDDGRRYFDLKVQYKDLLLEVEASPDGRIREIDLNRRFAGIAAFFTRELPVAIDKLPPPVTASVGEHFPESKILSAFDGDNDGERFYRLRVQYKDLFLRVDVGADGRMLDVDTAK